MSRVAYVNGRYVPHGAASVHIEDRGFQFADSVYEVVTVLDGRLIDEAGHIARLARSLAELRIDWPMAPRGLRLVMRELVRRNGVERGLLYLQITRGRAAREFRFPAPGRSTLVMTTRWSAFAKPAQLADGVSVITVPDIRWLRRDIKTTGLLAQVLGKQAAVEAGAFEAWMVDPDGTVTEGCSSNAWIVTPAGGLVTRPPSHHMLNGVTRLTLLRLAGELGIAIDERAFTLQEAAAAAEAFMSSATTFALPITRIDGKPVGDGRPGPMVARLRTAYLAGADRAAPVLDALA
jgi:D-alanine transaminase